MLLQDLIDQLTELKESVGGEREVRLANQPSWPFEYTISNVLAVDPNAEDVAAYKKAIEDGEVLVEDMKDALDTIADLEAQSTENTVVYICEGTQLGYTSSSHWT